MDRVMRLMLQASIRPLHLRKLRTRVMSITSVFERSVEDYVSWEGIVIFKTIVEERDGMFPVSEHTKAHALCMAIEKLLIPEDYQKLQEKIPVFLGMDEVLAQERSYLSNFKLYLDTITYESRRKTQPILTREESTRLRWQTFMFLLLISQVGASVSARVSVFRELSESQKITGCEVLAFQDALSLFSPTTVSTPYQTFLRNVLFYYCCTAESGNIYMVDIREWILSIGNSAHANLCVLLRSTRISLTARHPTWRMFEELLDDVDANGPLLFFHLSGFVLSANRM